jgi:hypothetical protein
MARFRLSLFALLLSFTACAAIYTPRQPLPISEVVDMAKANVPSEEIIRRIRQSGTAYALRGSDFHKLKAVGLADPVIDDLQQSFVDDMDLLTRYWVLGYNLGGCSFCYPQPVDLDAMQSGFAATGAPSPTRYTYNKPPGTPQWVAASLPPSIRRLNIDQILQLAKSGMPDAQLIDSIRHSRLDHVIGVGGLTAIRTRPAAGLSGSTLARLHDLGLSDAVLDAIQAQFFAQFIEAERLRYQNWGNGPGGSIR